MNVVKHAIVIAATFAVLLPFLWPLRNISDIPVTATVWLLVALSAICNVVVITYHYTVPAHPKFLMLWWRRAILRAHITAGTFELFFGLWVLLDSGNELAGTLMAVTAIFFHVPSALGQTSIVFGSKAIMRPAYLACTGVHFFSAVMLFNNPDSRYWAASTFLVFNVYVWCRIYYYVFDKFGLFEGTRYSTSILVAGLTTIPGVLGASSIVVVVLACAAYMGLYSLFFIRDKNEFHEFVRERARDSAYSEEVMALWADQGSINDKQAASEFFDHFDADKDGSVTPDELKMVLSKSAIPTETIKRFIESKDGGSSLDFDGFFAHFWPIQEVREHAQQVIGVAAAKSDRDKAEFVFKRLDLDGNGQLDRFELEALLSEWALPEKETSRWLKRVGAVEGQALDFDVFFRTMRPIWRFVYYDIVEARHGRKEDMIVRAVTAQRDSFATWNVKKQLRRSLVDRVSFLEGANEAFLGELASSLVEELAESGEVLFREGDQGDGFWLIRSGRVRVTTGGELLGTLGQGDWIGEGAILSDGPRSATVDVAEDAVLFGMSRSSFNFLLDKFPEMRLNVENIHEERRLGQMRHIVQRQLLGRAPFLSDAPSALLDALTDALKRDAAEGVVFYEGDSGVRFFLVGAGSVDLLRGGDLVAKLTSGAYFGEGALLSGEPRSASAIADPGTILYSFDRGDFEQILGDHLEVASHIYTSHLERRAEMVKGILKKNLLRRVSFFHDADDGFLEALRSDLIPMSFEDGSTIFEEGDVGDRFFLIVDGAVLILRDGQLIAELSRGAFFGEMALLTSNPRSAGAVAFGRVELLALQRDSFETMVKLHPNVADHLNEARRIREAKNRRHSPTAGPGA